MTKTHTHLEEDADGELLRVLESTCTYPDCEQTLAEKRVEELENALRLWKDLDEHDDPGDVWGSRWDFAAAETRRLLSAKAVP